MRTFQYLRDKLFLSASSLYAVNRWLIKPHTHNTFLRFHFNDLLLIPCALPPLLLFQRWLKLRQDDRMPAPGEIALYLTVWSVLFECIAPHLIRRATGDWLDVVAYILGGFLSGLWWNRGSVSLSAQPHEL